MKPKHIRAFKVRDQRFHLTDRFIKFSFLRFVCFLAFVKSVYLFFCADCFVNSGNME